VSSVSLPDVDHRGISRLRLIWGGFIAVVLIGTGIVVVGVPWPSNDLGPLFSVIIGVLVVIDFGSVFWFRRIGAQAILSAESNDEIRDAYTRRMVLACAIAMTPPLLAFTFVLVAGTTTVFFIIAVASFVLLALAGPRRGDIDVLDDHMVEAGRPFRVAAALDS
jgi:hypothetical protein